MSMRGSCPACGVPVEFDEAALGERASCPGCGAEMVLAAASEEAGAGSRESEEVRVEVREEVSADRGGAPAPVEAVPSPGAVTATATTATAVMATAGLAVEPGAVSATGTTLEQVRQGSHYQALRALVGLSAFLCYAAAVGLCLLALATILAPENSLLLGVPAGLVLFGAAAVVAFLTRAAHEAALLLVDMADCSVRILGRLNAAASRQGSGDAPAATAPKPGGTPATGQPEAR